ncbi:MAG: signal peptidase I [Planctomycetota bacterium]
MADDPSSPPDADGGAPAEDAARPRPLNAPGRGDGSVGKTGKKADEPKGFWARQWKGWIRPIGVTVLVVVLIRTWAVDWNDVPSGSMEARDSVLTGDRVVVWKSAYDARMPWPLPFLSELRKFDFFRYSGPGRGDVVTFWNPQTDVRMIKRIVAIPGDTITMRRGELRIVDSGGSDVPVTYQDVSTSPLRRLPGSTDQWYDYIETIGGESHTIQRAQPMGGLSETRLAQLGPIPGIGQISVQDSRLMLDDAEVDIAVWRDALFRAYQFAEGMPTQTQQQQRQRDGVIGLLRATQIAQLRTNFGPITLQDYPGRDDADQYWCMGDNRDNSSDSRFFGVPTVNYRPIRWPTKPSELQAGQLRVTSRDITGKVFAIAWSLDQNWVPRWGRFFNGVD